ncbi:Dimethyladenosine transferase [Patulibacter medicamentivorans]|uniref:Ribosomal RNA small subunit methyltransferase A n=1 Tax=Patulibacter medicamentivorans TaxID=1097667 RepID=H0E1M7_9ACTN|nr:16S rRNA (adenine(1518)-N(6)/adenine(1519)-N(6))-dimethyltransferase RsmA [Patulibacter medicamentivorans]EHN12422.1 Dimethyladenosine transferase [Patulibacter medicamentivorans]
MSEDGPTQPSLRRMRAHGVRPKRDLGQNFLVDDNILGVIARLAELREDDVALEVGGGLGVLSEHLAPRVAALHVVELDRSLEEPLREALAPWEGGDPARPRVQLHLADAMRIDLSTLDPAPTVCVSNLPYSVAAGVILRSVVDLPSVDRWVAMVQKEVGQRFAAAPGTSAYGAPSALAQLSCDVRVLRGVSRTVFAPVPNVDSVLVGLRRVRPPAPAFVRALVNAGFAHRRKALARSISLAGGGSERRDHVRTALEQVGLPLDVRAERLSGLQFVELGAALAALEGNAPAASEIRAWQEATA